MMSLAAKMPFVTPIWLSRNFGQHPATLAGMASSNGDWVISMDEDGQYDPRDMGRLLDTAVEQDVQLVYAQPTTLRLTVEFEIASALSPSGFLQPYWDTGISENLTAFASFEGRLRAAWQRIAAMASFLTWLSHGSWAGELAVRWSCAGNVGDPRDTRIANLRTISGTSC